MTIKETNRSSVLSNQMDELYLSAFQSKYITKEALEGNERLHFFDVEDEIDYKIQINHVRSKYSKEMAGVKKPQLPNGAKCPICIENVGSKGKENLKHLPIDLGSTPFFLQLTPFPLYHHHFVLISEEHKPMEVSADSFKNQLHFLDMQPEYTVCSNSDREWAGASILSHLHYQVFKKLELPIFNTKVKAQFIQNQVTYTLCKFPLTVIKLEADDRILMEIALQTVLSKWKGANSDNTFNTAMRKVNNGYQVYLLFRNPAYRTPENLLKYKYEGVGVIEACGEGILPTPEGEDAQELNAAIKKEGKEIIKGILNGLNPLSEGDALAFFYQLKA
ncbi:hypothetical protein EI427_22570 [Flammeovirga pectinis]|uniref:DUF4922 domain-containing protein n=1 Tax=Flammeovirga pectinis TaxID=2494373 RepID=A0A3Q9FUY7_9BACT|nr:DUF4922 domain-containing protein [Flammeovirga pectinis]AZQ65007.1 hypothetical protein EI427_22570 [Flammeovirga pectinis]